jgi:hypothetical protein
VKQTTAQASTCDETWYAPSPSLCWPMQEMAKGARMWRAQGERNREIAQSEGRQSIFTIVAQRRKGLCAKK